MNKKINICFFSHSSNLGGAERSLLQLVKECLEKKIKCSVIIPGNGPLKSMLLDLDISVKVLRKMGWWCSISIEHCIKEIIATLKDELPEILDFTQKISPTVIYTQTIVNPFGAMVAEILNIPHLWGIREYQVSGHNFWFGFRDSMDAMYKTSDYIFCISKSAANIVLGRFKDNKNVVINYTNIKIPKQFQDKDFKLFDSKIKIGIFGRITPNKNQEDIIKAVLLLLNMGYNIDLFIVGEKLLGYYNYLIALIRDSKFKNKIKFIDFTDKPLMLMSKMDIIVSCSKIEALGRTLLEASLLSIPIIYSNVGGPKEIFRNNIHGLSYNVGDEKDLANKIIQTIKDIDNTRKRVIEAKKYVGEKFNKTIFSESLLKSIFLLEKTGYPSRKKQYVTNLILSKFLKT